MSRRTLATLPGLFAGAAIALACTACTASKSSPPTDDAQAASRDVYRMLPTRPVVSSGKVIGMFTLADATVGKDADAFESPGTGGACMVGDFSATFGPHACTTTADCDSLLQDFHQAAKDGVAIEARHAYCLTTNDGGSKRCWIRPGDYCLRAVARPLVVGEENMLPAAPADPLQNGKPVRWRVHACLNGYDVAGAVPGCRSGNATTSRTWDSLVLEVQ